jgi:hypothetical protein
LVLSSMLEGSELCIKGTHDGGRSGMVGTAAAQGCSTQSK